jgi:16S rRNA (cytidine1402-2'-O)-methyltransferase
VSAPAPGGGRLVLVPTPIGNLGDMTPRAVEELRRADHIAAEDTRTSRRLLDHFGVATPVSSYHDFSTERDRLRLVARLRAGETVALISDAGMPGISDPAYRLVNAALDEGFPVSALPGASSILPALAASGLPTDRFTFLGFLPRKKGRKTAFEELSAAAETTVFLESPHRLEATLASLVEAVPGRRLCVAREISKLHEEFVRGTVEEVRGHFARQGVRGEFVLVLEGAGACARRRRREAGEAGPETVEDED